MVAQVNSIKHLKKEITSILNNLFQITEEKEKQIILESQHDSHTQTKRLNKKDNHRCESPQQNSSKSNPAIYKVYDITRQLQS